MPKHKRTKTLKSPPKKTSKRVPRSIPKWKKVKPDSIASRKKVKSKYGSRCFLVPNKLKYPICSKYSGKINCNALNAADYYLNINIGRTTKKVNKLLKNNNGKFIKSEKNKIKKYYNIKKKLYSVKKRACQ